MPCEVTFSPLLMTVTREEMQVTDFQAKFPRKKFELRELI